MAYPKDQCLDPYYFWSSLEILTERSLKPVSSFADDTRVSLGVTSEDDTKCLQNDLEAI